MFLSAFADEAASDLAGQIRCIQTLGWTHIDLRKVDGRHVHEHGEDAWKAGSIANSQTDTVGVIGGTGILNP